MTIQYIPSIDEIRWSNYGDLPAYLENIYSYNLDLLFDGNNNDYEDNNFYKTPTYAPKFFNAQGDLEKNNYGSHWGQLSKSKQPFRQSRRGQEQSSNLSSSRRGGDWEEQINWEGTPIAELRKSKDQQDSLFDDSLSLLDTNYSDILSKDNRLDSFPSIDPSIKRELGERELGDEEIRDE